MTIIEDTRQQAGKHARKHQFFADNNIQVVRSKLPVGDYANIKDLSLIIDTKKDIQELAGNVTKGHKRFVAECDLAARSGIALVILVENQHGITQADQLGRWHNPRLRYSPKATTGEQLAKILHGIAVRHGVRFLFCTPEEAGEKIIELLGGKEYADPARIHQAAPEASALGLVSG